MVFPGGDGVGVGDGKIPIEDTKTSSYGDTITLLQTSYNITDFRVGQERVRVERSSIPL